ncbi:type VI secretion system ATPase TssH [Neisseria zoodegmatis]|uniref:ClpB protein n=1 Tax=Neisseria zoodegmatis TaxID=326523 RepID=A0AB38DPE4_9NEIS|nr:type VI secretion system ATPase TssH [Neisseria zoodegmatis]OSI09436.1 ClpV1 family T6SS ATPase [Neisseria zoodegmatis]SNU79285.1 ClpB protein [Neisseria zoodegmatis]
MSAQNQAMLLRRLNAYCQQAMEAAASLCQTRGHAEITVDHLFIKLLELDEGDIVSILRRYEINSDGIWNPLLATMDKLPRNVRGNPSLSKSLVALLADAWLQASDDGSTEIRSSHLYIALLKSPYRLMSQDAWPLFSITETQIGRLKNWLDEVSTEGIQHTTHSAESSVEENAGKTESAALSVAPNNQNEALAKFTVNLTEKAQKGEIDPIFGRETEIRQMIDILLRRRKNNPILVGEPGVGKTALVEGLALKIAANEVPNILKDTQLLVLDLGLLQAGAGVKGEFEQRLRNVIEAVQNAEKSTLLFIDEAHTLIGAGNSAGGADAANLLKPALARGELRTIAATTWSEYKQYFEKDAALERRFQMVKVDEPDDESAFTMLRGLKQRYAAYHNVHIQDSAIVAAVQLSRKYITGRQLPDKAVDLLDTASARVRMSLDTVPHQFSLMDAQAASLQREIEALKTDDLLSQATESQQEKMASVQKEFDELNSKKATLTARYESEKQLADKVQELIAQIKNPDLDDHARTQAKDELHAAQSELEKMASDDQSLIFTSVDESVIANIIADWTGVPTGSILKDELANLLQLEDIMSKRVVGQDEAIHAIAQSLRAVKAGLKTNESPLGVFLLSGPSGVGKTETALALADALFGGEKSLITINMSEYREAHTVSQLKGSPPGYVGYGQGGILTEAVRQKPYSVVLLDEIEKAHKDILNLFYQVFDKGIMRDGEGREIDFKNTVILMTSNLGADELIQLLQPVEETADEQTAADEAVEQNVEEAAQAEGEQTEAAAEDNTVEIPEYTQAELQEAIRPILVEHFQAALLARMQVILYRPLQTEALAEIVRLKLNKVAGHLYEQHQTKLVYSDEFINLLASSCTVSDSGARNIDHLLNQQVLPVIAQSFLQWQQSVGHPPKQATLGVNDGDIDVLFE